MIIRPYKQRRIRSLGLWRVVGWRLKVYGIACVRPAPHPDLIAAAKDIAKRRLESILATIQHYSVGFLGVHEGRTANFVFVDWWADENELHHHVYVSPTDQPSRFTYVTPTGLTGCVWDLRVMAFERQAWLETFLTRPRGPAVNAYLRQILNEDV